MFVTFLCEFCFWWLEVDVEHGLHLLCQVFECTVLEDDRVLFDRGVSLA